MKYHQKAANVIRDYQMRSFGLMIFFGLFFIVFLYIVMNFFNKKNEDFSSNIQGNVSGRESPLQPNSPVYIIKNLVGN